MNIKKFTLIFLSGILLSSNIYAAKNNEEEKPFTYKDYHHFSIQLRGGGTVLDGDVKQNYNQIFPKASYLYTFAGVVQWDWNQYWGIGVEYLYSPYSGIYNDPGQNRYSFIGHAHEISLFGSINLANALAPYRKKSVWNVYANAGMGISLYKINKYDKTENVNFFQLMKEDPYAVTRKSRSFVFPVSLSVEYNPIKELGISLQAEYRIHNKDNYEGAVYKGNQNDNFVTLTLGLRYKIGRYKNGKDHVRNLAPFTSTFDAKELEARMDSLEAAQRVCCDAIQEELAKYRELLSLDSDNDSIPDVLDLCPGTPIGVEVDENGCPIDSDEDGVADFLDKCPYVKGPVSNNGCPEVTEKAKEVFSRAMRGIHFETAKDIIKPISYPILDEIVNVLNENPAYKLDIYGHSDNVGGYDYNMELSKKRALAVKQYLIEKGKVDPNRILEVEGFGFSKPEADNATESGRALNRRVEFIVQY